jgi:phosphopantothenoylcysteine decarboxylase/phosphopantothenate--cysteine ligase
VKQKKNGLKNSAVLLGLTGSVASYKAPDLIKALRQEGASVTVVMTDASCRFITPLSLEIASGNRVYRGLFDEPLPAPHISLARDSDLLLVAPATANSIGKFASGVADDLLSTLYAAFRGEVVIAPAMNWRMYDHPTLRKNLQYVKSLGVMEVQPGEGRLACGEEGRGRMASLEMIVEAACSALTEKSLSGRKLVVTAGPTREYMDAVRFISNPSSGKMGYALARKAGRMGAEVTLVSGPTELPPPGGVSFRAVESAAEMREAVLESLKGAHALIMAAAVGDFRPAAKAEGKMEKSRIRSIKAERTPDILAEVGSKKRRPVIVGFAAEAGGNLERARKKLRAKGADIMVYNDIAAEGSGFGTDTNRVVIMDEGGAEEYPLLSKDEVAGLILDRLASLWA